MEGFRKGFWLLVLLVAMCVSCGSQTERTENGMKRHLSPGIPCSEIIAEQGSISASTHDGDLVSGWEFVLKHPIGFAAHGCQIVSSEQGHPTRSGRYSIKFEVRDGDCNRNDGWDDCSTDRSRHEITQGGFGGRQHQYEGDEYWYSWSMSMPAIPLKTGDAITFLGQFHSDNAARFYIEDFSKGLGYRFNDADYDIIEQGVLIQNSVSRSRWIDVVIHARWSSTEQGFIHVFIDGESKRYLSGPNMDGATRVYFDFGIYNAFVSECNCDTMPTQIVYFDDVRRGSTRGEVERQ